MAVDFVLFRRLASRCIEVTRDPGASPVIMAVYQASSREPLTRFLAAFAEVEEGVSRWNRARAGAARALAELDPVFRSARSAVAAVEPAEVLPKTLKALTTDTDKRRAIERLLEIIGRFAGEAWADVLLQGAFGQQGAATIQAITGAYHAGVALDRARKARASAFKPAWAAFLGFRRVVREAYGKSSNQYQRLRVRDAASAVEEAEVTVAEGPGAALPNGLAARMRPTGGRRDPSVHLRPGSLRANMTWPLRSEDLPCSVPTVLTISRSTSTIAPTARSPGCSRMVARRRRRRSGWPSRLGVALEEQA
ncbi:MAG TPA: hypothetical protein VL025_05690 [Thermoanaerobaculia bacterium]|nr:hypothetical protein [Thermoanaerobaculia bacterium]